MYSLSSPLNATIYSPAVSENSFSNSPPLPLCKHLTNLSPFHSNSEPAFPNLALSECHTVIYSYHVQGHKNAGVSLINWWDFSLQCVYILHRRYALYHRIYGLVPKSLIFISECQVICSGDCNKAAFIHCSFIWFSDIWERGMYSSLLESYLKSKAKARTFNVRPHKPPTHANLKFNAQVLFTFVSVVLCVCVCLWGSLDIVVNHCQSEDPHHQPGLCFIYFCFLLYFDVKFCPTDWKYMGYWMRISNWTWRSFLWSNTVPYPSCQAQIPLHCLISMVVPIIGRKAWNVSNKLKKQVGSHRVPKKAWKEDVVTGD